MELCCLLLPSLVVMLFYLLLCDRIVRSRFGVNLAAINENEDVARMMGVNVDRYKVFYYVFPSILTGIVGRFIVHTFFALLCRCHYPLNSRSKLHHRPRWGKGFSVWCRSWGLSRVHRGRFFALFRACELLRFSPRTHPPHRYLATGGGIMWSVP